MDILILRDPREPSAKCSLTPLQGMPGVRFVRYQNDLRVPADGRILLSPEGELLTAADRGRGLFLIDCSWRRVPQLARTIDGEFSLRRLPELITAYPRRSRMNDDPPTGLASIEALYAAAVILGEPTNRLLDRYRWRDDFLRANAEWIDGQRSRLREGAQ